ncbi:hypothetical protein C5L39_10575 [Corynebacterium alimapuense]|uniref:Uncharacterized protein n=1 Tax=Corynebacterium alimapuense TaxID=1576874 RepID=A0A3M8K488_9CORY|nr:hypothetical protein C5L39_10575 [Corynebacterium alimapuense]
MDGQGADTAEISESLKVKADPFVEFNGDNFQLSRSAEGNLNDSEISAVSANIHSTNEQIRRAEMMNLQQSWLGINQLFSEPRIAHLLKIQGKMECNFSQKEKMT